jgi:hypothetical protein
VRAVASLAQPSTRDTPPRIPADAIVSQAAD